MDSDSGLPPNWIVRFSKSKSLPYYYNTATKDSQWDPPADADEVKLKAYIARNFPASAIEPQTGPSGKIRCAHLLVKHKGSRKPSSWKTAEITRTKEEAMSIILGYEAKIRAGSVHLADLAVEESDCSSARKRGDLYTPLGPYSSWSCANMCTSTEGISEEVICRRSLRMLPLR
ncbi:hypothetical protein L211DRAFT_839954 [Terfezia boudieri ATCC MYA-4762]|uniref:Peptidyl-prolyl cis-trans isomerase n=1 Tax=Terfezia boudieri ATCC MYA-4762 TaxID=1051890 RepID=A0A3N4LHT3_9PEZI|nr:hypothetical protein L211DRAFT_839954 [Terfezia boudieri ATCC MYA-4762]